MGLVEAWGESAVGWFFANLIESFYNLFYALLHPSQWLAWLSSINGPLDNEEVKLSLLRFIYYGASVELFFVYIMLFMVLFAVGVFYNQIMWGYVRVLEGFANRMGRLFAWAGLLMVLQQVVIIFMQRIFASNEISVGFGFNFARDVSWWSEELKLYNAMIVALCVSYTFVQGGHVRVDLIYSNISFRAKRVVDMVGSLVLMIPCTVLIWLYGWYMMWGQLVVRRINADDSFERVVNASRGVRWNITTTGASPNGFDAYFLFPILLVAFAGLVLLQVMAVFFRSYLEFKEGEASEGKNLDKDPIGDPTAELVAKIH